MSPLKMRDLLEGSDIARWRFQQKVMQKTCAPVPWSIQSITPKSAGGDSWNMY